MRRIARAAAALLAFLTLATPTAPGPGPGPGTPVAARLFARPVALDEAAPGQRQLGPFRYVSGWVLSSDDRRFGSISSMHVENGWVLAVGDRGTLFRFAVPSHGSSEVAILPLRQGPGAFRSNVERDAESLAIAAGHAWVAFENSNEIWRYRLPDWAAVARAAPSPLRRWPANRGAEAMARLQDGRFLLIQEDDGDDGTSQAVLFAGDPAMPDTISLTVRYRPPKGHRITDAALLPNGRLILLSRGFTWRGGWSAKLLTADLPSKAGQTLQTFEVATLAAPLTVDNMEALAVTSEGGRTILWLASDDNLNPLQRTLLMKFELME